MLDVQEDVLHLVHNKPRLWNDVARELSNALKLPLVPYAEWLEVLGRAMAEIGSEPSDIESAFDRIPALRLLDFFRAAGKEVDDPDSEPLGVPRLASEKAQFLSSALRDARPLDESHVRGWLRFWRDSGFLPS